MFFSEQLVQAYADTRGTVQVTVSARCSRQSSHLYAFSHFSSTTAVRVFDNGFGAEFVHSEHVDQNEARI